MSNACVVCLLMVAVWLISVLMKNVGIIDIAWGLGFVLIAWNTANESGLIEKGGSVVSWCLVGMATVWGLRLAIYLAIRNLGHAEDKRYAAMRTVRPKSFWWQSLGMVFGLQGVVLWLVALPLQMAIAQSPPSWNLFHTLGLLVWLVGLFFETVGDWQLASFRANPANQGQVLDRGLWKYTRHPNYFGDACVWWGFGIMATAAGDHLWTLFSPLAMTILLLRVSGVTLLESTLRKEKPAYEAYIRRTSPFFPWPPKPIVIPHLDNPNS